MLKKLMITTAAAALMAGSALAQQSPAPPAGQTPAMKQDSPPAAKQDAAPMRQDAAAGKQIITEQKADQWLASKFKGTDVIGANNEKIGDVDDILFEKDGRAVAYIVGVGGFLGIGSKEVALAPSSFQVQPATDREELKLKLSMTKDELRAAPEFKPYTQPSRTSSTPQRPGGPTTGQAPRDSQTPSGPSGGAAPQRP
jgi:hypothetical protein